MNSWSDIRRLGQVLAACYISLFAQNASAAEAYVVFGSWQSEQYAYAALLDVQRAFGITPRIIPVVVRGDTYFRVASESMAEAEARALITRAAAGGYDTWLAREVLPPPQPAAADPPQTEQSTVPAPSPQAQPEPESQSTPDADPAAVSAPAGPVRAAPPTDSRRSLAFAGDSGTIQVPYFDDVDIQIDGKVDETVWQQVPGHGNMLVTEPDTGDQPAYATNSRFIYSKRGLYVSAVMEQPRDTLVNRLSGRDQFLNRDSYHITIDPSGTGLYGYWFEVSLGGSVLDGKVVPERSFSEQWDGPWLGASAVTENGWSAELFLPWSMMAMPFSDEERTLGFWVRRKVAHMDETYSWPALPFNQPRFMSALHAMAVPGIQPKQNFAIFPFTSATIDEIDDEDDFEAGFDFSYRPSSNLQITGTLNPDFGAVESDDVVVNLTAFETFFPEKRLFFLEGNEVFVTSPRSDTNRFNPRPKGTGPRATPSTFNPEPTTLMNTRRIGGAPKHIDIPDSIDVDDVERNEPTDLLGAVKVVGQTGTLRYGVLAAFEDDVELDGIDTLSGRETTVDGPGRDFGVVRALYERVGAGRVALGYMGTLVTLPGDDSTVHGLDGHYLSPNGKLRIDGQYMYSDVAEGAGHGFFADANYSPSRMWLHRFSLDYLDKKLEINDLGFINRNDAMGLRYGVVRTQTRGLKNFRNMRSSLFFSNQWSIEGFANRNGVFSNQTWGLLNRSEVKVTLNYFPEQWDDRNSRGNGMFKIEDQFFTQIAYGTDTAKRFSWSGTLTAEQEDLSGWTYGSDLGFTYKPSGRFSLDFDVRYKKRDGWLIYRGGRNLTTYESSDLQPSLAADFFFTARHQLRLSLQWAGIKADGQEYWEVPISEGPLVRREVQPDPGSEDFTISRLTAQLRYRWEIGPLSDLFVVYTRGSNLPNQVDSEFDELFGDAFDEPIVDVIVIKLRYRFGF